MIKLKTFSIEQAEEANTFMKKNPPRSTDKQSGIIFHNGSIVIIYDDGVDNDYEIVGTIRGEIEGATKRLFIIEHKVRTAKLALEKIKPEGYVSGMTNSKLRDLLKAQTGDKYIPADKLDSMQAQIESLEQTLMIDAHETERINLETDAYRAMLKEYGKGK